jgi:signal peptidase I
MRFFIVCIISISIIFAVSCGFYRKVSTENMLPTFKVGDHFYLNTFAYLSSPIERFDLVVFLAPDDVKELNNLENNAQFMKRIIGLPNEKIEIRDNEIYINDKQLSEPFEKIVDEKDRKKSFRSFTIPKDEYFLLGDNRPNSLDSRYWKNPTIKKSDILGKVIR